MPDVASVPDHETVKLVDDCEAPSAATAEAGAVASSVIASEARADTLPSASRNHANRFLAPSPAVSWNGALAANGCQLLSTKVPLADPRISVTATLSEADRLSVTARDLVNAAPPLIEMLAPVGLSASATRVQVSAAPGHASTLPTPSVARERKQ